MKFLEFFQDKNGQLSSNRFMFMFASLAVVIGWLMVTIVKGELQAIDWSIIALIGTFMSGKVVQKKME